MRARDYQARQFTTLVQTEHKHRYLCVACASGKTFVGLALLQHELRESLRFTHALLLSPTKVVQGGWDTSKMSENRRKFESQDFEVLVDSDLIQGVDSRVVLSVVDYLTSPNPKRIALSICHASWPKVMRHIQEILGDTFDASKMLIGVDEQHHAAADTFAEADLRWERAGGSFFGMTATHFRLDGREVLRRDSLVLYRSMSQQMEAGYSPWNLEFQFEPLLLNRESPDIENIEAAARAMVKMIVADRDLDSGLLPKFTVYVPGQGRLKDILKVDDDDDDGDDGAISSGTYLLAERFKTLMLDWVRENADPSQQDQIIMDVTDGRGKTPYYLRLLAMEREHQTWGQSRVLGVVGSKRMIEGIDWKWASACYMFSASSSAGLVVQFAGRGQRCKTDLMTYPSCFTETTLFRVLTPMYRDSRMDHAEMVMKMALILGDIRHGNLLAKLIHRPETSTGRIVPARQAARPRPNSRKDENESNTQEGLPENYLHGRLMDAEARAILLAFAYNCLSGGVSQVGEVRERLLNLGASEDDANWILVEIILRNHPERQRQWVHLIQENEWRRLPRLQVEHALSALVADCRDEHIRLEAVPQFQEAMREISRWVPGALQNLAEQFQRSLRPLLPQTFLEWGLAYYRANRRWPMKSTPGGPEEGESWSRLHNAVVEGARGLSQFSSLEEAFIYYENGDRILDVLEWGYEYREACQTEEVERFLIQSDLPAIATLWHSYIATRNAFGCPYPRHLFLNVGAVTLCRVLGTPTARRYGPNIIQAFRVELERRILEGEKFTRDSLQSLFNFYRPGFGASRT